MLILRLSVGTTRPFHAKQPLPDPQGKTGVRKREWWSRNAKAAAQARVAARIAPKRPLRALVARSFSDEFYGNECVLVATVDVPLIVSCQIFSRWPTKTLKLQK
jgi:hypothetical protein